MQCVYIYISIFQISWSSHKVSYRARCLKTSQQSKGVRYLLWVQNLISVMPLSLSCYMHYHVLDIVKTILGRCQAIIWTNAGILIIQTLGTNFNEILSKIRTFSFNKMHWKMLSGKWLPFCVSLNILTHKRYPLLVLCISHTYITYIYFQVPTIPYIHYPRQPIMLTNYMASCEKEAASFDDAYLVWCMVRQRTRHET